MKSERVDFMSPACCNAAPFSFVAWFPSDPGSDVDAARRDAVKGRDMTFEFDQSNIPIHDAFKSQLVALRMRLDSPAQMLISQLRSSRKLVRTWVQEMSVPFESNFFLETFFEFIRKWETELKTLSDLCQLCLVPLEKSASSSPRLPSNDFWRFQLAMSDGSGVSTKSLEAELRTVWSEAECSFLHALARVAFESHKLREQYSNVWKDVLSSLGDPYLLAYVADNCEATGSITSLLCAKSPLLEHIRKNGDWRSHSDAVKHAMHSLVNVFGVWKACLKHVETLLLDLLDSLVQENQGNAKSHNNLNRTESP